MERQGIASSSSADGMWQLALRVRRSLEQGTLTLRQAVGLDDAEMQAVVELAESWRRRGDLLRASAVYGLLISYDPFDPSYWRSLADLQRNQGLHVVALACYEVLAALQDRSADATYHQAHCLRQLDQAELADETLRRSLEIAAMQTVQPPWATSARRQLQRRKR